MPTISVIVPVYKVEPYLHRCVDSILAQTFEDFELILVDDGSPDNCPAICDDYAAKDNRIYVIHQENGGLSAARNAGIDWAFANSDSQWLSFIDSDDWVHPEYLEFLLSAAIENNVSVSICGYAKTTGEEPVIASEAFLPKRWEPEDFFVSHNVNATVAWGKLYRKEHFTHIRYPIGRVHEDEFITYKILFSHKHVAVLPAELYCYYTNPAGIVGSGQSRFKEDKYIAIEEQIQFFQAHGYSDACRAQIRIYMCMVMDKLHWFAENGCKNSAFLAFVKNRRKKLFIPYALQLNPAEDTDGWVLTKAFPKSMWIYWRWQALKKKLGFDRTESV